MKNLALKIKNYISAHKITSIIVLILIIFIGYYGYGKLTNTAGETRYVLGKVTRSTIVSNVTGTGQVSALNQLDIKPNVSGTITYLNVKPGDKVSAGKTLFSIDDADAQKAVRDAEVNLESAKISLEKFKIQNSNDNMSASLVKAYDDGFSAVSSTFLDLPSTVTGLQTILSQQNLSDNTTRASGNTATNYRNQAETLYYKAQDVLNKNQRDFALVNRNSPKADIENIINETYNTTKTLADAITSLKSFVDYLAQDTGATSSFTSTINTLSTYTSTTNSHLASLATAQTNIKNNKDAFTNTDLDTKSSLLSVKQKENALADAKSKLSDYYIRAPFSGTIASVPVLKGDNVSSSTVLGTIITTQQIATVSLNEVDIAKIQLGQKVTLTFDAVSDLTITGKVAQIDLIGTVSQGVVNYSVKISFDTTDARIKPGMSVSASIITGIKQDVLVVPNGAIKNQGISNYVEMFDVVLPEPLPGVQGSPSLVPPRKQNITIGASNDTVTEIVSGLNEGDSIVTKTITGTTTATTAPSLLNAVGGNRGGGAARIPGR